MARISLGSNTDSLRAQRVLASASDAIAASAARLSSGLRINHASDDAAGLSVATSLNAGSKIFAQGIQNLNDGISALNIAGGALDQLGSITMRQKELAEQAANGAYSFTQRKALAAESNALTKEFNRIVATTSFNGLGLLDRSTTSLALQAGTGANGIINLGLDVSLSFAVGDGTFTALTTIGTAGQPSAVALGDVNGDGIIDEVHSASLVGNVGVSLGVGDGTFGAETTFSAGGGASGVQLADLNGDGNLDIISANQFGNVTVLDGRGDGTFAGPRTLVLGGSPFDVQVGDLNGDGKSDLVVTTTTNTIAVFKGNGNGTFSAAAILSPPPLPNRVRLADFNNDGKLDIMSVGTGVAVMLGNGDATFRSSLVSSILSSTSGLDVADLNGDGNIDVVVAGIGAQAVAALGRGDGTFTVSATLSSPGVSSYDPVLLSDLNGDGIPDAAIASRSNGTMSVFFGNGDGTFGATHDSSTFAGGWDVDAADLNGDGIPDLVSANRSSSSLSPLLGRSTQTTLAPRLDLYSRAGALAALPVLDTQLQRVTSELASLGAGQQRAQVALQSLGAARINYEAAASRISDTDTAMETSNYARLQILQSSAAAVLAQANLGPRMALSLLET